MARFGLLLIITFVYMVAPPVFAQSASVWVTVQDNAALRAGPGRSWPRLAVLPFDATYPATGRTLDGRWIQIAYPGPLDPGAPDAFTRDGVTYGWLSASLLIWTGNVLNLRVDGVSGLGGPVPDLGVITARAQGPLLPLNPDTEVYQGDYGPAVRVPSPAPGPVRVEATGRIGTFAGGAIWLQFKIGGQFYWMSVAAPPPTYESLPDGSYLFSYSRLLVALQRNLAAFNPVAADIGSRWEALRSAGAASCNDVPAPLRLRGFAPADLAREPLFAPAGAALVTAQAALNQALADFGAVCAFPASPVEPAAINAALAQLADAQRSLSLASALLLPLQRRDPLAPAP